MIRKSTSLGCTLDIYICNECKTEEFSPAMGVQVTGAINSALPRGWLRDIQYSGGKAYAMDYLPALRGPS